MAGLCRGRLDTLARGYKGSEWEGVAAGGQVVLAGNYVFLVICEDPAPVLEAARRLGLKPEECVGVEDSDTGLKALTAAGCVRVMVPDLLPCDERVSGLVDHVLQDLSQLCPLIDRLNMDKKVKG